MSKINNLPTLFFSLFLLFACSEEDTQVATELEGVWKSQCLNLSAFAGFGTPTTSVAAIKFQNTYKGTTVESHVLEYSDTTCTTLVVSTAAINSELFVSVPAESFVIGKEVDTSDGYTAKEIDFTLSDGTLSKNIFLIQDNTLYFGGIPSSCAGFNLVTESEQFLNCLNETRSDTVSFSLGYAKNGEPVIITPPSTLPTL